MATSTHQVLSTVILLLCLCLGIICKSNASTDDGSDKALNVTGTILEQHFSTMCSESKDITIIQEPLRCTSREDNMPNQLLLLLLSVPKNALKVVHRFGPCSPFDVDAPPDNDQIFRLDLQRVAYLQQRYNRARRSTTDHAAAGNKSADPLQESLHNAALAARDGNYIGAPSHVVTVRIGSVSMPEQTMVFDTASMVSWIQCSPCYLCFHQVDMIFFPARSPTYMRVPCRDPACLRLPAGTMKCDSSFCKYNFSYGPSEFTSGTLSMDTLLLPTTAGGIRRFVFGCSHWSEMGTFQGAAGILGLGTGYNSLVTQTSNIFEQVFSYCLPSLTSATGYLLLGRKDHPSPTSYTPMPQNSHTGLNQYHIDLKGISVDNVRLTLTPVIFQTGGTIIDSGVIISRIPAMAYVELRMSFRIRMAQLGHQLSPPVGVLDTCYHVISRAPIQYPSITLHFENVDLPLTFAQTFMYMSHSNSTYCLGFAPSGRTGSLSIIGTLQQRGMEVIYNVGEGKIGFSHVSNCP